MNTKVCILSAAAFAVAAGCGNPSPNAVEDKPGSIVMKGEVDPGLFGSWKYINGIYTFKRDGSYDVHFDYMRPDGPGQPDKHVFGDDKGKWSADNQYVYFKSSFGNVISDKFELNPEGSTLKLYPRYVKVPEVLRRISKK